MLRIADYQNPGLLTQFGKQLFQKWLTEGRITRRPDGTFDWGTQEDFDDLNALLRAAVITELRPYLNRIREGIPATDIDRVAWTGRSAAGLVRDLEPIVDTWYVRTAVTPTACVTTQCEPCEGQNPQPYCPAGECVSGCGANCSNCEMIGVTPAPEPPPVPSCPPGMSDEECFPVEITQKPRT